MKKNIVFVCVENSNRSQMAEAFAKMYGSNFITAYSSGSAPSGKINPRAIKAMKEVGYDLQTHQSKSLDELPVLEFDYLIGMGCKDNCPIIKAKEKREWNLPDPKNMNHKEFNTIRDIIKEKVLFLIEEIRKEN